MLNIDRKVYDIIGIGIGPFNLGLAALVYDIPQLNCIFFDQSPEFNWHAGMMLPNARLQVPFYADLVTVVNPCSRFSYLNFLKEKKRLFRFAILENNFILRKEYNAYCQWVVEQLDGLHFHHKVVDVQYEAKEELYLVMVHNLASDSLLFYYTKHLVVGVGSVPHVPSFDPSASSGQAQPRMTASQNIFHSSEYLFHREDILRQAQDDKPRVTIVGSGQSAAEIFYDLLQESEQLQSLHWFTRSERFFPMDYSKFALEMTSVDYIDHFYSLKRHKKRETLRNQNMLYKGINFSLIDDIYNLLYEQNHSHVFLHSTVHLQEILAQDEIILTEFFHSELEKKFLHETDVLILATGYRHCVPDFFQSVKERIVWTNDEPFFVHRNYSIDTNASEIFVQNAELHSHGFSAPDLGMGPYRNATILNAILGYEHFDLEKRIAFQSFGLPE